MNNERNTDQKTDFASIPLDDKVRGVLLDLDNTLYAYDRCHDAGLRAVYAKHHKSSGIAYEDFINLYKIAQKSVKSKIPDHGSSHSRLLYFQRLTEKRDGKTNIHETVDSDRTYWNAFNQAIKLHDQAVDFLKKCRKKGIPICLVTDLTASVQFHKITAIGAEGLIDLIVTSEEAGAEKPARAIFDLALEKLCLEPGDVIMIGDDKRKDIDGATSVGIKAYMV